MTYDKENAPLRMTVVDITQLVCPSCGHILGTTEGSVAVSRGELLHLAEKAGVIPCPRCRKNLIYGGME